MSLIQQIPDGLKPQEVERGSGRLDPPIPYVPEKTDELDPDRKVPTIKVELSNGVESRIVLWDGIGTSEQFLSHMMAVREGLEGMGLFKKHEEAEAKVSEMRKQLKKAKDQKELTLREIDESALEADKAMFREQAASQGDDVKKLKAGVAEAKEEVTAAMAVIFSTTSNFFRGEGKTPWDKIVTEQTERDPWTDLRGAEQSGVRGKTWQAWQDCYILMLKTVFANNAAEQQKFYLTCLRYCPKMRVRAFLQRFTTLAGYVKELPGVIHSRDATDNTKVVAPYEDNELATIMLHSFPVKWKTQYDLGHKAPPNSEYLQNALEKIEVAFPLNGGNGNSKNSGGKPGKMSSLNDKIPKKKSHASKYEKPAGKSCALCKKFGGASATHNTQDCKKWDSKGNLKKGFKGRVDSETPPGTGKSYAQLFAETEKLKAKSKKLKKALKKKSARKKRKWHESSDSDTSDSDSE